MTDKLSDYDQGVCDSHKADIKLFEHLTDTILSLEDKLDGMKHWRRWALIAGGAFLTRLVIDASVLWGR